MLYFSRQAAELELIRARANFYKVQAKNQVKLGKILDEVQLTAKAVKTDALMRLADTKRRAQDPEKFPPSQGFASVSSLGIDFESLMKINERCYDDS